MNVYLRVKYTPRHKVVNNVVEKIYDASDPIISSWARNAAYMTIKRGTRLNIKGVIMRQIKEELC